MENYMAELLRLVLILDSVLVLVSSLQNLTLRFMWLIQSNIGFLTREQSMSTASLKVNGEDFGHRREDVEMVMERIGLPLSYEGEQLLERERMDFKNISNMFEEREASLEEVEAAFCVFDENCDGFIDAVELQRVLSKLGFTEGLDLGACQMMIASHDENQDGRIDFHEFVRFMERSSC